MNGKLSPWHKSAAAMSIVVLFDPTTDFWSRILFADKVGPAVEETRDVKAVIDFCKELPLIVFVSSTTMPLMLPTEQLHLPAFLLDF